MTQSLPICPREKQEGSVANGECGSGDRCGFGESSHFLQLLPRLSPRPKPLIAEYVVEEVKEDDFVPVEQLIHMHLHIFI